MASKYLTVSDNSVNLELIYDNYYECAVEGVA